MPEPSLIQQRMALDRIRTGGVVTVILGAIYLAAITRNVFDATADWLDWAMVLLAAGLVVMGVTQLLRYRRKVTQFEAEHGPAAGKQQRL